jgi:hypothetical protein
MSPKETALKIIRFERPDRILPGLPRYGVSTATVMSGPVERIAAEARRRMWQLGRQGGYFCCPDQGLPFPPGHMEALHRAVAEYGLYPLTPPEQ